MDEVTLGVEEEYFLLQPVSGRPVPLAEEVRTAAGLLPAVDPGEVHSELLRCQIEVATPVCVHLDEVGGHLLRLRHSLAAAAESRGCRLAACGTAPFAPPRPAEVSSSPRYRTLKEDAPRLVDEQLICGMHVHVGVPDRDTGVAVLNRLRPWLPVLTAMAANSPIWQGTDTGFASWRTVVFGRWPVSGIPPLFEDAGDYLRRTRALVDCGQVRDLGQLYWHARLSERYPTIEVRAMDVQLRPDEAVLLAGLVRALVIAASEAEQAGEPLVRRPPESLAAASWHAARHGLDHTLHDPFMGRPHKAGDIVAELLKYALGALQRTGDERQVSSLLHRLLRDGNGASRQRGSMAGRNNLRALVRTVTESGAAA